MSDGKKKPKPRQPLTRERVVSAALDLVDHEGIECLTMRNLGRVLGVDPMAAYHWFPNKRAILQGVYEAILDEVDIPAAPGAEWPEVLRDIARSYQSALARHPNAVPMISTEPVMTRRGLQLVERAARALVRAGLSPLQAIDAINGVAALAIGSTLAKAGVTPGTDPVRPEDLEALFTQLDPAEFPTMLSAMKEAGADAFDRPSGFDQLLDALILGLHAQLQGRAGLPKVPTNVEP